MTDSGLLGQFRTKQVRARTRAFESWSRGPWPRKQTGANMDHHRNSIGWLLRGVLTWIISAAALGANALAQTAPTIEVGRGADRVASSGSVQITFSLSEASSDFDASDVDTTFGELRNWQQTANTYTADFHPFSDTEATAIISVDSNAFTNAGGIPNADGADANNSVSIAVDTIAPVPTLEGESVVLNLPDGVIDYYRGDTIQSITLAWSEPVFDLSLSDIQVTNSNDEWSVDYIVNASAESGAIKFEITLTDDAGNTTAQPVTTLIEDSDELGVTLDTVVPTVVATNNGPATNPQTVTLNGSDSSDANGIDSYAWTQVDADNSTTAVPDSASSYVQLTDEDSSQATFTAPEVTVATNLYFALEVVDGFGNADTAWTTVTINPPSETDGEPDIQVLTSNGAVIPSDGNGVHDLGTVKNRPLDIYYRIENNGDADLQVNSISTSDHLNIDGAVQFRLDNSNDVLSTPFSIAPEASVSLATRIRDK